MISIDTALLRELVSASSVANDAIDNAVDALNRVSTHNNWGCKEKYAINEYAITNRNKIKQLQENSRGFLNVITQVSNEFETSENSIIDMFSTVESVLADALMIPIKPMHQIENISTDISELIPGKISRVFENFPILGPGKTVSDFICESISVFEPFEKFEIERFIEPIAVCKFEDINF